MQDIINKQVVYIVKLTNKQGGIFHCQGSDFIWRRQIRLEFIKQAGWNKRAGCLDSILGWNFSFFPWAFVSWVENKEHACLLLSRRHFILSTHGYLRQFLGFFKFCQLSKLIYYNDLHRKFYNCTNFSLPGLILAPLTSSLGTSFVLLYCNAWGGINLLAFNDICMESGLGGWLQITVKNLLYFG